MIMSSVYIVFVMDEKSLNVYYIWIKGKTAMASGGHVSKVNFFKAIFGSTVYSRYLELQGTGQNVLSYQLQEVAKS